MEEDFTALLNTLGVDVHWQRQPSRQNSFPYINLTFVSSPTEYTTQGETGLQSASIQVDSWAKTYSETVTLARSVTALLSGFKGLQGGTVFKGIFKANEFDRSGDLLGVAGDTQLHGRSADYQIAYSQS